MTRTKIESAIAAKEFRRLAKVIAGEHWRTRIGAEIDKCRSQVWGYGSGNLPVPKTVARLMQELAKQKSRQ